MDNENIRIFSSQVLEKKPAIDYIYTGTAHRLCTANIQFI